MGAVAVDAVIGVADQPRAQVTFQQKGQVVHVAGVGRLQPLVQKGDLLVLPVIHSQHPLLLLLLLPFQGADKIAAPFDQHRRNLLLQHLAQEGDVLCVELALQGFVGGGDNDCAPAEQSGQEIGDGFACARGGFDDGRAFVQHGLLDSFGHLQLAGAQFVAVQHLSQGATRAEEVGQIGRFQQGRVVLMRALLLVGWGRVLIHKIPIAKGIVQAIHSSVGIKFGGEGVALHRPQSSTNVR